MRKPLRIGEQVARHVHGSSGAYVEGSRQIQYPVMTGTIIHINREHYHYTVDFGNHVRETYFMGAKTC